MAGPPSYEEAQEMSYPQVVLPEAFQKWLLTEPITDDLEPLRYGMRYSPEAVRTMITAFMTGIYHPERGYLGAKSFQAALNAGMYGWFNDFLTHPEFDQLIERHVLRDYLCTQEEDMLTAEHPLCHSRVYGTLEGASLDPLWLAPGKTKVFFNGTWNGFPHPGHILFIDSTLNQIAEEFGIPEDNMTVMIAGDQNQEIAGWGKEPFGDTLLRLTLMSYLHNVDLVAPAGSWGKGGDAHRHWDYKLGLIRPDFISLEVDDPLLKSKTERAQKFGITVINNYRHGAWVPEVHPDGTVTMERNPGQVLSSRNLIEDRVIALGVEPDFRFTNPYAHLGAKKEILDRMGAKRDWFGREPGELEPIQAF